MATRTPKKPLTEAQKPELVIQRKALMGTPLTADQIARLRRSVSTESWASMARKERVQQMTAAEKCR
jgi:hypothetical protein